jgi:hypothetical protein
LADLLPGRFGGDATLDRLNELEQFCGSKEPIRLPASQPDDPTSQRRLAVPHLTDVKGAVEAKQDNIPLVVRGPYGFGEVVFVALDLDRSPFATWPDRPRLLNLLLGKPAEGHKPASEKGDPGTGQVLHAGVTDMAGQLKGALDQFTGINPVSFPLVAGLALLYVAVIGPLDYLLVRRVLRRPELTWVTFPVAVVAFSLAIYGLAGWMKADQLLLNQVDVVDVELATGHVRGQTWFNVYSPSGRTYDVRATPHLPSGERDADTGRPVERSAPDEMSTAVSWLGLPGAALGGMERSGTPGLFQGRYEFQAGSAGASADSPSVAMEGVPIRAWSSKAFTARWTSPAQAANRAMWSPLLDAELRWNRDSIEGTLRNRMSVSLQDCLLVFRASGSSGRSAQLIRIPELVAGGLATVGSLGGADDLAAHLRGFRYVNDDKPSATLTRRAKDYNPLGTDVPHILKLMSFYQQIDGRGHTHLLNRYQSHVDLSSLLNEKFPDRRAILLGFSSKPAAEVQLGEGTSEGDAPNQHWTCYRFVIEIGD